MQTPEHLIMDTHAWIWLVLGDNRIKKAAISSRILKAAQHSNLSISAISVWEIAMLHAKDRISFSTNLDGWIQNALAVPGLKLIPLSPAIAIDSTRLPGDFHGDPADRIIAATTRHLNGVLVTADKQILHYASAGSHIKVLALG